MEPVHAIADRVRRTADRWLEHVPDDDVSLWDFSAPQHGSTPRDTSATAIAAAALLRLSVLVPERKGYWERATATVGTLVGDYLTPVAEGDERPRGMLTSGCFDKRRDVATDSELIWGDYSLLESLLVIDGVVDPTAL